MLIYLLNHLIYITMKLFICNASFLHIIVLIYELVSTQYTETIFIGRQSALLFRIFYWIKEHKFNIYEVIVNGCINRETDFSVRI